MSFFKVGHETMTGGLLLPVPLLELLEYGGYPIDCVTPEKWSSTTIGFTGNVMQ